MATFVDTGLRVEQADRVTEKALGFLVFRNPAKQADGAAWLWFPKSLVREEGADHGFVDTIHVPAWFARKELPFRIVKW